MFAVLSRAWDIEKILSLHEETNLRPFGFRAPMFYHWETDSTVNEVYYEVHTVHTYYMTWERVSFELGKGIEKDVFRLVTSVGQRNILSPHESSS